MRILTNPHGVEKDYYDHISYMYRDERITFDRTLSVVSAKDSKYLVNKYVKDKETIQFATSLIGFCGKLYPVIQVLETKIEKSGKKVFNQIINFYDIESFNQYVDTVEVDKYFSAGRAAKRYVESFFNGLNELTDLYKDLLNEHVIFTIKARDFRTIELKYKDVKNSFNKAEFYIFNKNAMKDISFFASGNFVCVINDGLFPLNFESIVSAEEAFQEIEMFLAKKYCIEKHVDIAEKDRISAKGFDKNSFRRG